MTKLKWLWTYVRQAPSAPRVFSTVRSQVIDSLQALEEECLPGYTVRQFYPVKIGEVLGTEYQVLGKLGFGATSTVWLCRNLFARSYVVIKIYIQEAKFGSRMNNEIEIYKRLTSMNSEHPGKHAFRVILDSFTITGPYGHHDCIVHVPLAASLQWLRWRFPTHTLPEPLLKVTTMEILKALDFLHHDANVIHTDLKASNFLTTMEDETLLSRFDAAELETPSRYKIVEDRFIYQSRELKCPKKWGSLILTDLGEARVGAQQYKHPIQPKLYRAPEIMLQMDWDHKVDIWNLGVMIWDLLEGTFLFDGDDADGNYSEARHLAEMTGFFGNPPVEFLKRSRNSQDFFNDDGTLKHDPQVVYPSFEKRIDVAGRDLFLSFIRSALQWDPKQRKNAKELLHHPWLQT